MVATLFGGPRSWSGGRDDEGHQEFHIFHIVKTDSKYDGPNTVMNCPGLPLPGSYWNFGNDVNIWAFCYPWMKVSIHQEKEGDANFWFKVEQKFSTKPMKRCNDTAIEDPLMEPDRISGSFTKFTREYQKDRHGAYLTNSAWEIFRGQQAEFDDNRPAVRIEQNVASLELDVFSQMIDHVNDAPLWGVGPRCVKLSNVPWERKLYGSCSFYYTRTLEFDISYTTFDRDILDEGTKALHGVNIDGVWTVKPIKSLPSVVMPNPNNPLHFVRYRDKKGDLARCILNGAGLPIPNLDNTPLTESSKTTTSVGTWAEFAVAVTLEEANPLILLGMFVSGPGITSGTTVSAISGTSLTLSLATTAAGTKRNLTFRSINGPGSKHVEIYNESNFLTLGIPTSL